MKILFIVNSLNAGGAERTLVDIATHLDPADYVVEVLCLQRGGFFRSALSSRIRVEELDLSPRIRGKELRAIVRAIRSRRPDVVHNFLRSSVRWGTVAARLARARVVINSLQNCHYGEGSVPIVFDFLVARLMTHAVSCSDAVRRFYVDRRGFPSSKVTTVYNAVDTQVFRPSADRSYLFDQLRVPRDTTVVGTVASLTAQKGHTYLLDAARTVITRHAKTVFLFAGEGVLRSELEAKSHALGMSEHVRFLGLRRDIAKLVPCFDVFVLPSLWEGMGVAAAEAMAAGVPVVASNVDGLAELVVHGETGLLVEPKNHHDLARELATLIADERLRHRYGRAAQLRAAQHFSLPTMIAGFESVYRTATAP